MQYSTSELIRLIDEGNVSAPEPEDVYIVNDPYLGGTHLMDVRFVRPYYGKSSGVGCQIPVIGLIQVGACPEGFRPRRHLLNKRG